MQDNSVYKIEKSFLKDFKLCKVLRLRALFRNMSFAIIILPNGPCIFFILPFHALVKASESCCRKKHILIFFVCVIQSWKEIQKQPPRGVPRKRCFENMQQIYRRTPMSKCDFSKVALHFCMGVLLKICCIFSEHFFVRTPLCGCFWKYQLEVKYWACFSQERWVFPGMKITRKRVVSYG